MSGVGLKILGKNNWVRVFRIGNHSREELQICHLLYADDTVIFCEGKAGELSYIRVVIENFPTTYLGMPLSNSHRELEIWEGIPGRITLINSVLDSLPTYVMSVFPIPSRVEERLDKLEDNTIIYMVVNLEKETIDVLRILPILFRQSKNCFNTLYFWCKGVVVDER
ncbi:hypothetical protein H5410_010510 [Solanum commersonii]|uniref:Uncharacterized protein n=1 Tax=Solanum commersonii TaxID=4109 RepID=A0A9J6ALR8_SOLCO|nr:hypothetical protein H5410_010510 [Solanum commersonii]